MYLNCNPSYFFALKKLRQTVSTKAALMAYHGYVSSVLGYGLIVWGNSVDIDRAFRAQKKCIRAISNAWFDDSCKPLFRALNVLPLPCLYIRDVCVFVSSHPEIWKTRGEVLQRRTRCNIMNKLYKPPCFKDIYKKNVYNMCILLYNKLPVELKKLNGNVFKNNLTKWLLQHCFYSIREYLNFEYWFWIFYM